MKRTSRFFAAVALLGATGLASAHPGHSVQTLFDGLSHPFGLDHLLAMVAVGVWSTLAFQGARRWLAPATFLAAMAGGAVLGLAGISLPFTESGLALSVTAFGLMLIAGRRLEPVGGLMVVAFAASLHGLAHGAEVPVGASAAVYAAGFLATTAALHLTGLGLGNALVNARSLVWRTLGGALGVAGLLLLARG